MMPGQKSKVTSYREQALHKQRQEEYNVHDLQHYISSQRAQGDTNKREDTYEVRRRGAELDILAREEAMETMTRTAMLESRKVQREREQEHALVLEMERQKREEESRRREIQRICESDPGLRELQSKLQMAYINKERGMQLVEKEKLTKQKQDEEAAMAIAMEELRTNGSVKEQEAIEKKAAAAEERKRVLQAQLEERQLREFLEAEQEAARERAMVDAILSKIRAEDDAEATVKAKVRAETVAMIQEFKEQRERAVAHAKAAEKEEQKRIAEYLNSQSAREEEAKRGKAEETAVRDAQYRAIVAEQEATRKRQEDEDELRWLLVEEEAERRRREEEKRAKEVSERAKRDMRDANDAARAIREKIQEVEKMKEQKLIQQFLDKCAEDDRKNAQAARAREEAALRYRAEVAAQSQLKLALYEEQKLASLKEAEEVRRREEFKKRVIEEARRKLLGEHYNKLRGFMPRGVISGPADLELLKAFDGDGDGVLQPDEMELAQAAFRAFDPGAGIKAAANAVAGTEMGKQAVAALRPGSSRVPALTTSAMGMPASGAAADAGARNRHMGTKSSVTFGGEAGWDDPAARRRQ